MGCEYCIILSSIDAWFKHTSLEFHVWPTAKYFIKLRRLRFSR